MKKLLAALLVPAVMVPAIAYAQSNAPITRSEVQAQLVQAERDGDLHQSNAHYPEMHDGNASRAKQAYGSYIEGKTQSGSITQSSPHALEQSLYSHH